MTLVDASSVVDALYPSRTSEVCFVSHFIDETPGLKKAEEKFPKNKDLEGCTTEIQTLDVFVFEGHSSYGPWKQDPDPVESIKGEHMM